MARNQSGGGGFQRPGRFRVCARASSSSSSDAASQSCAQDGAERSGAELNGTAPHGTGRGLDSTHARTHAPSPCLLHVPAGSSPTSPMLDAQRGRTEIPPVTYEPWTVRAAAARSWWSGTRSVARRRCCMCSPRTATPRYVRRWVRNSSRFRPLVRDRQDTLETGS